MRAGGLLSLMVLAVPLTAGCAGQIPPPTTADAVRASTQFPGTTVEDLARGRRYYVEHCSGCHTLVRPATQPPGIWPKLVREMTGRSRLTDVKAADITRYLVIASSAPR